MKENYVHEKLKGIVYNILVFAKNTIKKDLSRNDYKEFLELIIILLRDTSLNGTEFRQLGAYYVAR